jgi:DNA-binding CsgD family transcriptional regulator
MLRDERQLSTLLGMIYDAAGDPTLWAPFIEKFAARTKSTSAALLVQDYDNALYSLSNSWRMLEESVRTYQEHYHTLDTWAEVALPKPSGYVCTSQSLCPLPKLKGKEFYNDFLVGACIEHGMFALVENNESCLASVCLYRDKSREEFGESELKTLQFFAPHLRRAFGLHAKFSELKSRNLSLETALDLLAIGVVFVGPSREVLLVNKKAEELLAVKDGLMIVQQKLIAASKQETTRLESLIVGAAATGRGKGFSPGGTTFISRADKRPLSITVTPLTNYSLGFGQRPSAALFISDPERKVEIATSALRQFYDLTTAETRLALVLLKGCSLKEAAATCGISHHTARSQLKSVFGKTSARRQSDLVRLLLTTLGQVRV